jgi:hypothetical protein
VKCIRKPATAWVAFARWMKSHGGPHYPTTNKVQLIFSFRYAKYRKTMIHRQAY